MSVNIGGFSSYVLDTKGLNSIQLVQSDGVVHRFDELFRIVAHSVLEHYFDVSDVGNLHSRISLYHNKIRLLARGNGAYAVVRLQELRAVQGRDFDGLDRTKLRFHKEFQVAQVAESGHRAAVSSWIDARDQGSACFDEIVLELLFLL